MNKVLTWMIVFVVVIALGAAGIYFRLSPKKPELKEVQVSRRQLKIIIQATGDIEAQNRVDILPAVAGRIEKILVEEGQMVKKNQVLTWMSSTNRAALLDLASSKDQAEYKQWEETYQPTPVLAPVTGLVTKRSVVPGMMVSTTSILFSMSDRLVVRAQVDETDIGKIREGMLAEVTCDAFPNETFQAHVHLIGHDSQLVNSVNIYLVELWPKNAPKFLRSGMTANVNFLLEEKNNILAMPVWSVQGRENETVALMDETGAPKKVQLGASDGKFVEVLSKTTDGEKFYITPVEIKLESKNDPFSGPSKRKPASR
jgi:membrane fusion protein, macrolide-specific efflux system